jgi:dihydroorotate dehydrogenase (fumarate)
MPDLTSAYLGLSLRNPLVASASPLSDSVEGAKRLSDAGVGAIVMSSLFEEQITHESLELDHYLHATTHTQAESATYFPDFEEYAIGPRVYLDHVRRLKDAVPIPVIGSLNGVSTGGWVEYARNIEDAGADALELNLYFLPGDPNVTGAEIERGYLALVRDICAQVSIPVSVKLTPFFTSLPQKALRLTQVGASGLVLFNRFYQPDFDIDSLSVVPRLELSQSRELRLPLQWIAMLYGNVAADLALTGGAHTGEDALKAIMAGASVAMLASELLARGPERVTAILEEMVAWMDAHDYVSIDQMRGSMSLRGLADPAAFERANYVKVLRSYRRLP